MPDDSSDIADGVRQTCVTSVKIPPITPTAHTMHTALTCRSEALCDRFKDRDALDMMGHRHHVEAAPSLQHAYALQDRARPQQPAASANLHLTRREAPVRSARWHAKSRRRGTTNSPLRRPKFNRTRAPRHPGHVHRLHNSSPEDVRPEPGGIVPPRYSPPEGIGPHRSAVADLHLPSMHCHRSDRSRQFAGRILVAQLGGNHRRHRGWACLSQHRPSTVEVPRDDDG